MDVKRIITSIIVIFAIIILPSQAAPISGGVEKDGLYYQNKLIDSQNGSPIPRAKVKVPSKNYSTTTDNDGSFLLEADINSPTIMSVEKQGYKPFSITVDKEILSKPIVIGIEKSSPADIVIEADLMHLGDDSFSDNSANASEFRVNAVGPFFTKKFKLTTPKLNEKAFLVIGSIIGVDTKMAQDLGQSGVTNTYASPPEIYFNNQKIAEIKINGDRQEILIPSNLIKNGINELTIKTGRNLFQRNYVDYDDIEIMNLFVEIK